MKEFKSKMIFFPINAKKPRKGDATAEEMSKAVRMAICGYMGLHGDEDSRQWLICSAKRSYASNFDKKTPG